MSRPSSPEIWVLLSLKPGDNNQSIALATCIGLPYVVKQLDWIPGKREERALSDAFLSDTSKAANERRRLGLIEPWPAAVICCGRHAERFALWIKAQSGSATKVLKIGRAGRSFGKYDLLVATAQFPVPPLPNVIQTAFPPILEINHVDFVRGQGSIEPDGPPPVPQPWFLILLGGEVKQYRTSCFALKKAAQKVQVAADRAGGSVVISTSRRTPEAMLSAMMDGLAKAPYVYRWSAARAENPYAQLLKESAAIFVTADSVSMIMDASSYGAPTFVIELPRRLNLRSWWDLNAFRSLTAVARWSGRFTGRTVEELIYRALGWLHRRRIARFPKDISRLHSSLYARDLARPISGFDPLSTPINPGRQQTAVSSQLLEVAARCRALLGLPNSSGCAEGCAAGPDFGEKGCTIKSQ